MQTIIEAIKREAILACGVALSAITAALASGSTLAVAVQSALPLVAAAVLRSLHNQPPPQGGCMADLTALNSAVAQLQADATNVAARVAALKADATPQADVDAVTASVQQASASIEAAIQ